MRNVYRILLSFCLLLVFSFSAKLYAQSSFEGKIQMKMNGGEDDNATVVNYYVKGSKFRFETTNEDEMGASILDAKNNKMIIIMPSQKRYMEMPFDFSGQKETALSDSEVTKIKKQMKDAVFTNNTKEILGYNCKEVIYKDQDNGETTDMWYTSELGTFLPFSSKNPFAKRMSREDIPQDIKNLMSKGFFPMQITTKDSDGKVENDLQVTDVKKESLSDDMFTPPSDYQKMEMPGMFQKMMKNQ